MQGSLDTTVAACTIMRHGQQRSATWDIGDWLRGLGLGQYEASFRQNEVNESVLPKLTQEDVSQHQGAKSLELRAAMSMARLRRDQGKRERPAICLRRSTAGSPKASTRSI